MFLTCCSPRSSKTKGSRSRTWSWTVLETNTPAGIGEGLDTRGDVDAVAIEVVALDDHVAEIDADAQLDAVVRRDTEVVLGHRLLHLDRAAHRVDDAGKLHQHTVAGRLDDAALMLGDLRIEELAA